MFRSRLLLPAAALGVLLLVWGCAPAAQQAAPPEGSAAEQVEEQPPTQTSVTPAQQAQAEEQPIQQRRGRRPSPTEAPELGTPSLLIPGGAQAQQPQQPSSEPDPEVVVVQTTKGRFVIELYPGDAPQHVENFKKLVRQRFYEGAARRFHRYEPGFVIQGGDPKGDDTGGPGYTIPAEIKRKHVKGAVGMARKPDSVNPNKESNGSQFYICLDDLPQLDGEYTVFGQVIQGMETVERLRVGDEIVDMELRPRSSVVGQ